MKAAANTVCALSRIPVGLLTLQSPLKLYCIADRHYGRSNQPPREGGFFTSGERSASPTARILYALKPKRWFETSKFSMKSTLSAQRAIFITQVIDIQIYCSWSKPLDFFERLIRTISSAVKQESTGIPLLTSGNLWLIH
jgi:hypothetical protein